MNPQIHAWQRFTAWITLCMVLLATCMGASCTFDRLKGAQQRFVGRIALSQEADPNNPDSKADSWSAHFELAGTPEQGTLLLYTPVGTVVAEIEWQPHFASVKTSDTYQVYRDLDDLTYTYFEQSIPVAALFDWLRGQPTQQQIEGWEVDLTYAGRGTIKAQRLTPAPIIRLRAILDEYENNISAISAPEGFNRA